MGWTPEAVFFGLAAVLQGTLALLVVRRRPTEWMVLLALLFALNGLQSLGAFLNAAFGVPVLPGRTGFLNRLFFVSDFTTTLLVAYLALAYPHRPPWLRGRPWVLPTAFALSIAGGLAIFFVAPLDALFHDACPPWDCPTPFSVLAYAGLPDLAFPLLLVRWSRLLPEEASPSRRREFQWLFAAFALRGAHVATAFPVATLGAGFLAGGAPAWFKVAYGAVLLASMASVAFSLGHLLWRRRHTGSEAHRSIEVVVLFLLLGIAATVVGGFADLDPATSRTYFLDPLNSLDFLVVRPALVLLAFLHTQVLGPWREPRRTVPLLAGALSFGVLWVTLDARLGLAPPWRWPVAFAVAALLSAALAAVTFRLLRGRDQTAQERAVGHYANLLDDALRRGAIGAEARQRLEVERLRLGLARAQADALEQAARSTWGSNPLRPWLPGDRILGRYALERLLGEGGTGQAWLAHDDLADHRVVLKRTVRLDAVGRRSLLQESSALARLHHPNIVRLHRTEVVGREPVLVLEYAAGGSLADRLAAGKVPVPQALRITAQLLEALQAAHDAGIVHGDLKPHNVLLAADGSVRLCDFGLARPTAPVLQEQTEEAPRGSLRYLAPEQVQGRPATPRSDLYAAGLLLAEMLQGSHPIPASLDDFQVRAAIVAGLRPSPRLPSGLRDVVAKATAVAPSRRYASAAGMQVALALDAPRPKAPQRAAVA